MDRHSAPTDKSSHPYHGIPNKFPLNLSPLDNFIESDHVPVVVVALRDAEDELGSQVLRPGITLNGSYHIFQRPLIVQVYVTQPSVRVT